MVMTYTDNVRRLGISLAVSCFVIASLLLVVRSSAFADSGSIPGLTIDVNPIPSGDLPLDKMIKHKFSATNSGNTSLEIDFSVEVISPFIQEIRTVSPEPQTLYLEPGDTQVLMTKMDEKWGKIPVYLPGEINKPGRASRTYRWTFSEPSTGQTQTVDVQIDYSLVDDTRHTKEIDRNENVSGPLVVLATVLDQSGQPLKGAELKLTTGHWESVATSDGTGQVSFAGVPWREDWILEARSGGQDGLCPTSPEPCRERDPYWEATPVARDMVFVDEIGRDYSFQLQNPSWKSDYFLTDTIKNGVGFWRGSVDDSGDNVLLVQGMENWVQAKGMEKESRLFLYTTEGKLRWSYPMGWEAWGADLSRDSRWAAFVTSNPTKNLGVIDARTGDPVWIKTAQDITETTHPELDSKEIQISNTNQFLGIGGTDGTFLLTDLLTGTVQWSKFVHGQVRGILFDDADEFVYVGAGDGKAYKLNVSDGSLIWIGEIGSWPYVNGFQLSPDGTSLAAGGKYGDLTLLDTSSGETLWYYDLRDIVAWLDFSPDGNYLVAGGGGQYSTVLVDVSSGRKIWQIPMYSFHGRFTANGSLILIDNYLFDLKGNEIGHLVLSEDGCVPGCQGLFAYISDDMTRVIQTRRDIDPSAISLYFAEGKVDPVVPEAISNIEDTSGSDNSVEGQEVLMPQAPKLSDLAQCLIKQVGLKRAMEIANRIPPSPSDSELQILSGCAEASTQGHKIPVMPPSADHNPFMSDDENLVRCLVDGIGDQRYQELRGVPPSIPTSEEIDITKRCGMDEAIQSGSADSVNVPSVEANPFLSENPVVVRCLVERLGAVRYQELRGTLPSIPTNDEIEISGECMVTAFTAEKSRNVPKTPYVRHVESPEATQISGESMGSGSGGGCSSPVRHGQTPIGTIVLLVGVMSLGGRKLISR